MYLLLNLFWAAEHQINYVGFDCRSILFRNFVWFIFNLTQKQSVLSTVDINEVHGISILFFNVYSHSFGIPILIKVPSNHKLHCSSVNDSQTWMMVSLTMRQFLLM